MESVARAVDTSISEVWNCSELCIVSFVVSFGIQFCSELWDSVYKIVLKAYIYTLRVHQGPIQDSRKEGARPNLAKKMRKLIIFMTNLINVRSNVKAVVVEGK